MSWSEPPPPPPPYTGPGTDSPGDEPPPDPAAGPPVGPDPAAGPAAPVPSSHTTSWWAKAAVATVAAGVAGVVLGAGTVAVLQDDPAPAQQPASAGQAGPAGRADSGTGTHGPAGRVDGPGGYGGPVGRGVDPDGDDWTGGGRQQGDPQAGQGQPGQQPAPGGFVPPGRGSTQGSSGAS